MICDSRIVGDRNGKYRVGSVCPFSPVLSYLTLNIAVFKPLISLVLREGIFSKIPFIVGISGIGAVILVAFAIVFRIEKRRQKPKKVFVLKSELKNEKNNKFFEN